MSVVVEMFWMNGWGVALGGTLVPPTDAVFLLARTRVIEADPTTGAMIEQMRTRANLADPSTDAVVENPRTTTPLT